MIEQIIGKSQTHSLKLFTQEGIDWLEGRIFKRQTKRGEEFAVKCFVREKEIKLTPEEVVRQLYAHRLVEDYDYPVSRLAFEFPVYFGRETKRADIVVRDKNDLNVPYIVVEGVRRVMANARAESDLKPKKKSAPRKTAKGGK